MRRLGGSLSGAVVAAAWLCACQAVAQPSSELYQRVLADPSNVQLTIQYAEQSKQVGDYEAAISAYERLLLFNPTLPNLHYELGQLYFDLESYAAARPYFETLLAMANVPPALREGAQAYIKEIDLRLSPTRTRAYLHGGLRYQTNATAGPAFDLVNAQKDTRPRADWNAFGMATFDFARDYGSGREDTFEANISTYYAKQFEIDRVNLGVVELQAGPRMTLFPDTMMGVSGKVYGIVNGFTLADDPYLRTFGGGASARWKYSPRLVMEAAVEFRARKYYDSAEYPTAAEQSGDLITYSLAAGGILYGQTRWFFKGGYDRNQSGDDFWSYQRPFADIGIQTPIAIPLTYRAWLFTLYGGGSMQNFDRPDPSVDSNTTREDREWHVGLNVDADFNSTFGLRANLVFQKNESNIDTFSYKNFAVSFGPTLRF